MKKNINLILIFIFFFLGKASAQIALDFEALSPNLDFAPTIKTIDYLPLSNYHFFNPFYHNPAMAGIEEEKQLNLDWNRQLNHSFLASYEHPISSINSAIGMQYSYTSDLVSSIRHFGLAYNYRFNLNNKAKLNLGVQFSQASISINESFLGLGLEDKKDKWYHAPTLDLGWAIQVKNLRMGISVQNLFPTKMISTDRLINFYNIINGKRQINASVAYTFELSKKWNWSLAFLDRSNTADDFSSYLSFRKKYFVGTTCRVSEDDKWWIHFIGIKIKDKMNLQISFDAQKNDREDRRFFETLVQYQL